MTAPSPIAERWPADSDFRLLVPVIRAQSATPLMDVGDALASRGSGSGDVIGLVEIPRGGADSVPPLLAARRRDLLRWIAATDRTKPGAKLAIQTRVVHDIARGIREAVYENESNLIVIEWPGLTARRPRTLTAVLENLALEPPADLILVRPDQRRPHLSPGARILVPVRGGRNASLAIETAVALAGAHDGALTLLHVVDAGASRAARAAVEAGLGDLAGRLGRSAPELLVRRGPAAAAILEEAARHEVTIMGAIADPLPSRALVGSQLADTVRRLPGTVIIAKCRPR